MKIIIDIAHPADVHFFGFMANGLRENGHLIVIISRNKDVSLHLLKDLSFEKVLLGNRTFRTYVGQFYELVTRVAGIVKVIRKVKADLVLTRNPSGVLAAKICGIPSFYDTTDGCVSKLHFLLSYPFATWVTSPESLDESHGAKHLQYKGDLQASYLHPKRFVVDDTVLQAHGIKKRSYSIVRFVSMGAIHDHGEQGLGYEQKLEIVQNLKRYGKVFIVSEGPLPDEFSEYANPVQPDKFHHLLAYAKACVGDGVCVAAEAGFLAVPSLCISTYAAKLNYMKHLSEHYGLVKCLMPTSDIDLKAEISALVGTSLETLRLARQRYYEECVDPIDWYLDAIKEKCPN